MSTHFAIINHAEHSGHYHFEPDDDGWTYQQITGSHGSVLYEGDSEEEARDKLAAYLECDSMERGEYCYSHNPCPHR